MTKITRVVEHAHNDSERSRHGPISRASGSTNRGGRGGPGINLGNGVAVTRVQHNYKGSRHRSTSKILATLFLFLFLCFCFTTCICFYPDFYLKRDSQQAIRCTWRSLETLGIGRAMQLLPRGRINSRVEDRKRRKRIE